MKFPWFKRTGPLFLPVSFPGWVILLATLVFAVYSFIDIDKNSHSASDTLRPFFITLILIVLAYTLIAWISSRTPKS